jgi:polyhydroxybutyrate depolymerase
MAGVVALGVAAAAFPLAHSLTADRAPASAPRPPSSAPESSAPPVSTTKPADPAAPPLAIAATSSSVDWVEHKVEIAFQGVTRDYLVFRPAATAARPLPVVVTLAGCCVSASTEADRTNFRQVAGPAILVYPDYLNGTWNAGACCGTSAANHVDDVGFVTAVIAQVEAAQPDASHGPVYLAGYSNGGKLALDLACHEPALFAAVAVYGATRTSPCNNPAPESVLEMAGSTDPEVAITGPPVVQNGYTEPTVTQVLDGYLTADGCTPIQESATAGVVTETAWSRCGGGRQVRLAVFKGDNHSWPETSPSSPSGQQVMWDFFSALGATGG